MKNAPFKTQYNYIYSHLTQTANFEKTNAYVDLASKSHRHEKENTKRHVRSDWCVVALRFDFKKNWTYKKSSVHNMDNGEFRDT